MEVDAPAQPLAQPPAQPPAKPMPRPRMGAKPRPRPPFGRTQHALALTCRAARISKDKGQGKALKWTK